MNICRLVNFSNFGSNNGNQKCLNFETTMRICKIKGNNNKSILYFAIKEIYT